MGKVDADPTRFLRAPRQLYGGDLLSTKQLLAKVRRSLVPPHAGHPDIRPRGCSLHQTVCRADVWGKDALVAVTDQFGREVSETAAAIRHGHRHITYRRIDSLHFVDQWDRIFSGDERSSAEDHELLITVG